MYIKGNKYEEKNEYNDKIISKNVVCSYRSKYAFLFQRITAAQIDKNTALINVSDLGKRINNLPIELQENILKNLSYDDLQAFIQEFLIEREASKENTLH